VRAARRIAADAIVTAGQLQASDLVCKLARLNPASWSVRSAEHRFAVSASGTYIHALFGAFAIAVVRTASLSTFYNAHIFILRVDFTVILPCFSAFIL
jgi:hypothetical protein